MSQVEETFSTSLVEMLQQQRDEANEEIDRLEKILAEVVRELDRAEAPADAELPNRIRQLARTRTVALELADRTQKQFDAACAALDALEAPPSESIDERIAHLVAQLARRNRRRLPDERSSITQKFKLPYVRRGETTLVKGYATVGCYQDGTPGEVFIVLDKSGTTARGYADACATAISIALQYGVPLEVLAAKFIGTKFGPAGPTGNEEIPMASSVLDFVFRWMMKRWPPKTEAK